MAISRLVIPILVLLFILPSARAESPPTSSVSIYDQSILGQEDWYITSVGLTITSTDGNGIKRISYQIDEGIVTDVPFSPVLSSASTSFTYAVSGQHVLRYWATDAEDNIEDTKAYSFKVDVKAPHNYREFEVQRSGNEHTFIVSVSVSDIGSGLKADSAYVQYSVDQGITWGYYANPDNCNSQWMDNGWVQANTDPVEDGALSLSIITGAIDFCNSNWAIDKKVRFKILDMAGNESSKTFTINGAWLKVSGGDVSAALSINMNAIGREDNATALVLAGQAINSFTTQGAYLSEYTQASEPSYEDWKASLLPITPLPNGKLPQVAGTGKYLVNSSFSIDRVTFPTSVDEFTAVVFIEGDLIIRQSFNLHPKTSLVFFVRDRVLFDKDVEQAFGIYFAKGLIDSAYNGDANKTLTVNGSLLSMSDLDFTTRSLTGSGNTQTPSEVINFLPWNLINDKFISVVAPHGSFRWEELAP